jgi:DNA polymerase III subunit epsilon
MREIVLDTETTGLDPATGDRIVEIGCVELVNRIVSGRTWHAYINPERDMPQAAFDVHKLSAEFLSDKPVFSAIAEEFLAFVDGAPLIIHNAAFDSAFLNAELALLGRPSLPGDRIIDSLALARRKHPGAGNSLDALCKRYQIDASSRTVHGALIDAELLARVYIELLGGQQARLELSAERRRSGGVTGIAITVERPAPLPPRLDAAARSAHAAFIETLGPNALWRRYLRGSEAG